MKNAINDNVRFIAMRRAASILLVALLTSLTACTPKAEKAKAYYESGQQFLDKKDFVHAALQFRNAIKMKRDYADPWFGMAEVEVNNKNWNLAAGDLKKVLEIDPDYLKARSALAHLALISGDFEEALKQADLALHTAPNNPAIVAMKAAVLVKMGRGGEAVAEAHRALSIEANNLDALMVLAAERIAANDYVGAQKFVDQGLLSAPNAIGPRLFALSLYEKNGDLKNQEKTIREIIKVNPTDIVYSRLLVSFLVNQHQYDSAENELRLIVHSDPENVEANLDLVRLLAISPGKGPEVAAIELKRLIDKGGNVTRYRSVLAQLYFDLGKTDDSVTLLQEVISSEKTSDAGIAARLDLIDKFMSKKRLSEAEALVSEVLAVDPRNLEALRQKVAIATGRGKLDEAVGVLRKAVAELPGNPLLLQMLAAASERAGSLELAEKSMSDAFRLSSYDPRFGIEYARFLVRRGHSPHAESVLTDLLGTSPNNVEVMSFLAYLKLQRKDWQGAHDLAEAIKKTPGNSGLSSQIEVDALTGQNKPDEGIRVLLDSYASSPKNPEATFTLVKAYISEGKLAEAEDLLNAVLAEDPKNNTAQIYLSTIEANTKRGDQARLRLEAVISRYPGNPVGYGALAEFHAQQGNYDPAIKALKDGLVHAPKDINLRIALAKLYETTNNIDAAIQLYGEILADDPNSMIAANNYASLISDFRADRESIEKAASAAAILRASPVPEFKDTLGWILLLQGKYREALDLLKQSAAELPDTMLPNYHLGKAYAAIGLKRDATESYDHALKLARSETERGIVQSAFKELETSSSPDNSERR